MNQETTLALPAETKLRNGRVLELKINEGGENMKMVAKDGQPISCLEAYESINQISHHANMGGFAVTTNIYTNFGLKKMDRSELARYRAQVNRAAKTRSDIKRSWIIQGCFLVMYLVMVITLVAVGKIGWASAIFLLYVTTCIAPWFHMNSRILYYGSKD